MKFISHLLVLLSLVGCVVKKEYTVEATKKDHKTQADIDISTQQKEFSLTEHSATYNQAIIEVYPENNSIFVEQGFNPSETQTYNGDGELTGKFQCGFELNNESVLNYNLVDSSTLKIELNGEIYELKRIHDSGESLYGDWSHLKGGDNPSQLWNFYIQENGLMYVDFHCAR